MARAKPLRPEDRKAAIVAAAMPLIRAHGRDVSTRQLAEAAGVAEGTLFRVFADKDAIIDATLTALLDPGQLIADIGALPATKDLGHRITQLAELLHQRATEMVSFMMVLLQQAKRPQQTCLDSKLHKKQIARVTDALAASLEPFTDQLSVDPRRVALYLRILVMGASRAMLHADTPPTMDDIRDLLLNGVTGKSS